LEEAVSGKNKLEVRVQVLQEVGEYNTDLKNQLTVHVRGYKYNIHFQENGRLLAQSSAQESVVQGLREERKLWGKELAHQGAALAQDRGRLEAQLDTLTKECKALQVHTVDSSFAIKFVEELKKLCLGAAW
jgi:hypothetical protein